MAKIVEFRWKNSPRLWQAYKMETSWGPNKPKFMAINIRRPDSGDSMSLGMHNNFTRDNEFAEYVISLMDKVEPLEIRAEDVHEDDILRIESTTL